MKTRDYRALRRQVHNAFCPTGPGGGVDPTCSPGRAAAPASMEDALDRFNSTSKIVLGFGSGATGGITLDAGDGRHIDLMLRQDRDEGFNVRIDFGKMGRDDFSIGKNLDAGGLAMLRRVREIAAAYHQAGFRIEAQGSDPKRKEVYARFLSKMGLTRVRDGKNEVWNFVTNAKKRPGKKAPKSKARTAKIGRIDPSRTITLRKTFQAKVRRAFALLKGDVIRLISVEDALGLRETPHDFAGIVGNVGDNCGTGAGGFQPGNTCGSSEGGGESIQSLSRYEGKVTYKGQEYSIGGISKNGKSLMLRGGGKLVKVDPSEVKRVGGKPAATISTSVGSGATKHGADYLAGWPYPDSAWSSKFIGPNTSGNTVRESDFAGYVPPQGEKAMAAVASKVSDAVALSSSRVSFPDLYAQARTTTPSLTVPQFQGIVMRMSHEGKVRLSGHTRTLMDIDHTAAIPSQGEALYYAGKAQTSNAQWQPLTNAFCPTGPGGGVDPSCSPGGGGKTLTQEDSEDIENFLYVKVREGLFWKDRPKDKYDALRSSDKFAALVKSLPQYRGTVHRGATISPQELDRIKEGDSIAVDLNTSTTAAGEIRALDYTNQAFFPEERRTSGRLPVIYEIRGAVGADLQKAGFSSKNLQEVILPKGQTYQVVKVEKNVRIGSEYLGKENGVRVTLDTVTANTRWRFQPNPAKVKAFQSWIAAQLRQRIVNASSRQLWEAYALAGFRKGAGRSFDDYRKSDRALAQGSKDRLAFYDATREEFLRSSFARPETVEKIQLLAGRSYDDLEGVTDDMSLRMSRALTDGLTQGKHPNDIAKDLADQVDIGRDRAETIARTEIIRAHAEGQLNSLEQLGVEEVGVAVEWTVTEDEKLCPKCAALAGVVLKIEEAHGLIPRHPNAVFAGSTFVPYGECLEAVRADYRGPCIVLHASGAREHRTTIGPNHPVMTPRGMVKAANLREGDKVLYDLRQDAQLVPGVDRKQIPLTQNVFETFLASGSYPRVATASHDLHGDRVFCQGEVQAVTPAWGLLEIRQSGGIEKLREQNLFGTDTDPESVAGLRPGSECTWGVLLPPPGDVGGSDSWVLADDHFVWLQLDKVETGEYAGLAFDYTTESSLYCSDGFVVSNCRCAFLPANVGETTEAQTRTKRGIDSAIKESTDDGDDDWGADLDVAKDRPKSVLNQWRPLTNAFCPTGPGGGLDNSCSPRGPSVSKSGEGYASVSSIAKTMSALYKKTRNPMNGGECGAVARALELANPRLKPYAVVIPYDGSTEIAHLLVSADGGKTFIDGMGRRTKEQVLSKTTKGEVVPAKYHEDTNFRAGGYYEAADSKFEAGPYEKIQRLVTVETKDEEVSNAQPQWRPLANAFCPGPVEGGEQDNSCSPKGEGADEPTEARVKWHKDRGDRRKIEMVSIDDVVGEHDLGHDKDASDRWAGLLEEGIKKSGKVTALSAVKEGDRYRVTDGKHRLQALRSMGVKTVGLQVANARWRPIQNADGNCGIGSGGFQPSSSNLGQRVDNVFCATGPGGGIDPSCSPDVRGIPDFTSSTEAEDWLKRERVVSSVSLKGLNAREAKAVAESLRDSTKVAGIQLKLRSVEIRGGTTEATAFGYSNGHVIISPQAVEAARSHDRVKALARYTGEDAGKRSFVMEDARDGDEYLKIGVAHEIGHHLETALLLDLGKAARDVGGLLPKDIERVSGYATTHPVELFAEVHAMVSTGRKNQLPDQVSRWYEAALKTADPDPIRAFIHE